MTTGMTVRIEHPPWLAPLFITNPLPRYVLLPGGRGRGATMGVAAYCVEQMLLGRNILCLREHQNAIADSNIAVMKQVVREMGLESEFNLDLAYELRCTRTGAQTAFRGCAHNLNSIKSIAGYAVVWFEESEDLSQESIDILMPSFREPGQNIIFTYNPRYEEDPIEQFRRTLNESNSLELFATWQDNIFFPPELEVERLRCVEQTPERYGWIWEGKHKPEAASNPFGAELIKAAFERPHDFTDTSGDRVVGVDLAYTDNPDSDYTAMVMLDLNGNELKTARFREADDDKRLQRVYEFCQGAYYIMVDATDGRGGVLATKLGVMNPSHPNQSGVRDVQFTRPKKQGLVGGLAMRLAKRGLSLHSPELKLEMLDYGEDDKGGFGGLHGHDDLVTALMLANYCIDDRERIAPF